MNNLTKADIPVLHTGEAETFPVRAGYTATVLVEYDEDSGPPWDDCDGHGPVTDWVTRDKRPGELVLCCGRGGKRYYDYSGALKVARKDGWDAAPYSNTETKGQRAHKAVMADYEHLRAWCNEEWRYVGVTVRLYHNGQKVDDDTLWGLEDCNDYPAQHAAEQINYMVEHHIAERAQARLAAIHETRERQYWAGRDVVTV